MDSNDDCIDGRRPENLLTKARIPNMTNVCEILLYSTILWEAIPMKSGWRYNEMTMREGRLVTSED